MTEYELILKYKQGGDLATRNKIIMLNMSYIKYYAISYTHHSNYHDIVQEGVIALMRALEKYDVNAYDVKLATFAKREITSRMYRYFLRNDDVVVKYTTKGLERLHNNRSKYDIKDFALKDTIMAELNVTETDIDRYNKIGVVCDIEEFFDIKSQQPTPEEVAINNDELNEFNKLRGIVERLDSRSKDIITGRWLNDTSNTLSYYSSKYGVSKERIRQIEQESMVKVKGMLQENYYHI